MKTALCVVLSMVLCGVVLAQQSGPRGGLQSAPSQGDQERFREQKQRLLERIDRAISGLQKERACVQSAQDPEALKYCRLYI